MFGNLLDEVSGRGVGVLLGLMLGSVTTWVLARRRRMRVRQLILEGDARDTVVIHQHLIESIEVTRASVPHLSKRCMYWTWLSTSAPHNCRPNQSPGDDMKKYCDNRIWMPPDVSEQTSPRLSGYLFTSSISLSSFANCLSR